jgi:hypothetical protein
VRKEIHQGVLSGHLGEDKTLARVKECFYWRGYHNDVRDWCRQCPDCAATKSANPNNRAPLQSVKVGSPMQMVAVDIMGPFPESDNRNTHILVVRELIYSLHGSIRYSQSRSVDHC